MRNWQAQPRGGARIGKRANWTEFWKEKKQNKTKEKKEKKEKKKQQQQQQKNRLFSK